MVLQTEKGFSDRSISMFKVWGIKSVGYIWEAGTERQTLCCRIKLEACGWREESARYLAKKTRVHLRHPIRNILKASGKYQQERSVVGGRNWRTAKQLPTNSQHRLGLLSGPGRGGNSNFERYRRGWMAWDRSLDGNVRGPVYKQCSRLFSAFCLG